MSNEAMKRCLARLVSREMKIKTAVRFYYTLTKMAII